MKGKSAGAGGEIGKEVTVPRRHTIGRGISILGAFLLVFVLMAFLLAYLGGRQKGAGLWSDAVGVIEVRGVINGGDKIIKAIRDFAKTDHIRAVVLRWEFPGGGVAPAQEI